MTRSFGNRQEILSNSRLNTASECDFKYFMTYIKKKRPSKEASWFVFGKLVHTVAELFVKDPNTADLTPDEKVNWCVAKFKEVWGLKFGAELLQALEEFNDKFDYYIAMTQEYAIAKSGKPYKGPTFSNFYKNNFAKLADEDLKSLDTMAASKLDKINLKKPIGVLFSDGIKCVTNFAKLETLSTAATVLAEYKVDPPVDIGGSLVTGFIDRLEVFEDGEYDIIDYKTGTSHWSLEKVGNENQFALYAVVGKTLFGTPPKRVVVWDLMNQEVVSHKITEADMQRFLLRHAGNVRYKNYLDDYFASTDNPSFTVPAGRQSDICTRCDYATDPDPEVRCKFYVKFEEEKDVED